jgi:hypothetical protein
MAEEKIAKAEVNLDSGETHLRDSDGAEITETTAGQKAVKFIKKAVEYSPIGLSYTMSKSIMDSSIKLLDRAINENELNQVEDIRFSDIINLIKEGKDRFDTLDLTFNASKVNGININKIKNSINDKDVNVDLGKRGDLTMSIKVKYK